MAGGNLLHRVMSYVLNQLVVDTLSNSIAFQRFAVRTNKRIEAVSKMASQKKQELSEQMKDFSENFQSPPKDR
ncbi:hypothetical protein HS088_TW03G01151 [Tripterygium wilfordii]|uniref:Uncharacterized protein n=1 Tax=Tripterygium wilfordii TaxID=458696 RepID=A0A7J7DWZ4_TRIWF|nr:uncharacterized protein LOC119993385 [Tripterygium wilfordii]XP_038696459.1 uncharacterized protein LOC119993385 [Tripterygium wilfordii]KAF5750811.1 hypothetical protein HS088_TW03G01151 [Tripterygium wilfordii]